MKILFVHQGFPGQYIHIIRELSKDKKNIITGLGLNKETKNIPKNVEYIKYKIEQGNLKGLQPWLTDMESKVIRGEACGIKANEMKAKGYTPDIICGHPGWGELLFMKDIWPKSPILSYQEFYYRSEGFDTGFDKEFGAYNAWTDKARSRMKGANCLLSLDFSDWNITPTNFQKSSFPQRYQNKISVQHDGIDTNRAKPTNKTNIISINEGISIGMDDNVISFVNRSIEPYRGCHTFIRAIPEIQKRVKNSHIIIIGAQTGVSYGAECIEGEWKDVFLKEIEGDYDKSRVHFIGTINYETLIGILQRTNAHVYLTYPFVLSWSLLEAMSCEAPIVASSTLPVIEVINDGVNGLLTDFFNSKELAEKIGLLCRDKEKAKNLGKKARQTILKNYKLEECVKSQIELINLVARKIIA